MELHVRLSYVLLKFNNKNYKVNMCKPWISELKCELKKMKSCSVELWKINMFFLKVFNCVPSKVLERKLKLLMIIVFKTINKNNQPTK